jgi:hypothetical protein
MIRREFGYLLRLPRSILDIHDLLLEENVSQKKLQYSNPLNAFGAQYFSQSDEDGLTFEILRRLGISKGTFLEFGSGSGLENNTLSLLGKNFRGVWVDGGKCCFKVDPSWERFAFAQKWVTRENVTEIANDAMQFLATTNLNLVSIDLDGNDYHLCKRLLEDGVRPDIWILEFNGKFPLGMDFVMPYEELHSWGKNDYFGASISSFNSLLEENNYILVCVNGFTGLNAFFVKSEYQGKFDDVPRLLEELVIYPDYKIRKRHLHPASSRTVREIVQSNEVAGLHSE